MWGITARCDIIEQIETVTVGLSRQRNRIARTGRTIQSHRDIRDARLASVLATIAVTVFPDEVADARMRASR